MKSRFRCYPSPGRHIRTSLLLLFCLFALVKGHKWKIYGVILDLIRCPPSGQSDNYDIRPMSYLQSYRVRLSLFDLLLCCCLFPHSGGIIFSSSKNLTWRDMQHLVVRTSHPNHLLTNDWRTNGVGRKGTAPSTFLTVSNNPKLPLVKGNVQKALKLVIESSHTLCSCSAILWNRRALISFSPLQLATLMDMVYSMPVEL